jgi:hypothetical protein
LRIQNYVPQGASEPEDWGWNDTLSQWEDGANNPIDHGTDLDVNRIQSTEFDRAGRVISTRDTVGRVQYHVYDVMGRRTLSVQNYVVQGASTPDAWLWDEPNRGGKMVQAMPLIIAPTTTKISSRKPATTSQGKSWRHAIHAAHAPIISTMMRDDV